MEKFLDVYNKKELKRVPSYIRKDIDKVFVTGKTKQTLILPNGHKYYLGNKLNDLTGAQWTYFTNSIKSTNYLTSGPDNCAYKIRKIHPSPKPPPLLKEIIEFFTKENDLVFDYFAGVGGTLLAASMASRRAIGIELEQKYIKAYKEANKAMKLEEQTMIHGDSMKLLKSDDIKNLFKKQKASLILIDPPYYNMMAREKTADDILKYGKKGTPFSKSKKDLGNMNETEYWNSLIQCITDSLKYLKKNGHIAIFIKDLQPKGNQLNLLHADMIKKVSNIKNVKYLGMKIWCDNTVKLFPYGYPFEFVANQIHQFILFFKLLQ